jgi:PAS domain S-box-containing protein
MGRVRPAPEGAVPAVGENLSNLGQAASAPAEPGAPAPGVPVNGGKPASDFDRLFEQFGETVAATDAAVARLGEPILAEPAEPAEPPPAGPPVLEDDSRVLTGKLDGDRPPPAASGLSAAIDAALDKSADAIAALGAPGRGRREAEVFREVFRSFVENAPVGMFRLSPNGRFTQVNPALAGILGAQSSQDLIGADCAGVFSDAEEFARLSAQLDRREPVRDHQTLWRRLDGSSVIVRVHLRRLTDERGEVRTFEGSVQDVTDQQNRENQLLAEIAEVKRLAEKIASAPSPSGNQAALANLSASITARLTKLAETLDIARQIVGEVLITLQSSSDEVPLPQAIPVSGARPAGPRIPSATVARPPTPTRSTVPGPTAKAPPAPRPPPGVSPTSISSDLWPTIGPTGAPVLPPRPGAPAVPTKPPAVLTLTAPDGSSADLPVLDGELVSSREGLTPVSAAVAAPPATDKAPPRESTVPTQNSHHPGWYNVNDVIRDNASELQRRAKSALAGRNFQVRLRTRLRAVTPIRANPEELSDILNQLVASAVRAMRSSGTVTINTATVAKGTLLAITDDRTVLAVTDKERIFDNKFPPLDDRIKVLRACRLAMGRHGGKVGVLSEAGVGTTVTMRFPRPKAME